jgi:hypothetical protein
MSVTLLTGCAGRFIHELHLFEGEVFLYFTQHVSKHGMREPSSLSVVLTGVIRTEKTR